MQLKHLQTVTEAENCASKVLAIAWAPNNSKFACCMSDRLIHIFDEKGVKRDRFSTKPVDSKYGKKSYVVKGIAFSPDSLKIAVGQTDNIIFVYKIGKDWGEKKVICNKFPQQSAVTCLIWLTSGPIIYGLADGKVRIANAKTNKSHPLYSTDSYVIALAANSQGTGFISGHADGAVVRYYVTEDAAMEKMGRVVMHPVPPYALAWPNNHILAGGSDKKITIYSKDGQVATQFDYLRDSTEKDFTIACCSPSGQSVVVGSFDRIRVYNWSPRKMTWEETKPKEIANMYTVTALAWKRDGSRVACGTLCGAVELFESVLKRMVWKNKFEMAYVGPSQVIIKPLSTELQGIILKSQYGYEIEDVRIMGEDSYVFARTSDTILVGDLTRNLLSEVVWPNTGCHEKVYFDNPTVCLIFNAGELSLVEYGINEILASVRTEFVNPHLVSVRLNERCKASENNKKLAYLLDLKTICILDLVSGATIGQLSHDSKINWLELNETGRKLLFRDKKMRLNIFDIPSTTKTSILNYCTFVQWVVDSDVVVAQSRNNMCIWYNIDVPEQVTLITIKGEIVEIVRMDGKTEVVVQEGSHQLGYELDEGLVEFGTALHDNNFIRAITFLENLGDKPEAEGMWTNLANIAVAENNLKIAQRCYAALGDVACSHFLKETITTAENYAKEYGGNGMLCPDVLARMAMFNKTFKEAEAIYIEHNNLDKAIEMYQKLHKWDEALELAEMKSHPKSEELRNKYMKWLLESKQEDKAGEIKEREGDYETALNLYLKSNMPAKASRLLQNNYELLQNEEIVSRVISALVKAQLYEQAGDLCEKVNDTEKAFQYYRRGNAFAKAIELARYVAPSDVIILEEQWGDFLVSNKQLDAAINHYIEAGKTLKALQAAMDGKQWRKAVQIIQVIDDTEAVSKHYATLAQHFVSMRDFSTAEQMFLQAGMFQDAIDMYNQAGEWEMAHRLATKYLDSEKVSLMYINQAKDMEKQGKLKEAEKLYLSVSEPDAAISMYKKHQQYDQMMRLVTQHHPDLVQTTHLHLAQQLEGEGAFKSSEQHYISAGEWKSAVNMYRNAGMWDDAFRVAKNHGGVQARNQVAFLWAKSLGGESAVKLLSKLNLLEVSIDYACETYQFDFAFELAQSGLKSKLPDIHYKYAMTLEDEGKFQEAEEEFVKGGKPKEAVLMYIHNRDWDSAQRVAENHDPESVAEVLQEQAKDAFNNKNFQLFESLLLRAQLPELIIKYYQQSGMWADALRICKEYLPTYLAALKEQYDREVGVKGSKDANSLVSQAHEWEQNREYKAAIDCLLKVNSSNTKDHNLILKAWSKAADLTNRFLEEKQAVEVAKILGPKLVQAQQYNLAAQLYLNVDMIKEAIDTFISAEEWSKAKKIAKELEPMYETYVDNRYKDSLRKQGQADQLVDVDIIGALDLLAEQGQWARCLETAQPHGAQVLHKYVALYATQLIKDGDPIKALNLYMKYEAPAFTQNYNIYKRIAIDIFSLPDTMGPDAYSTWANLRNMLFQLTEAMKTTSDAGSKLHDEFDLLLVITHYYTSRCAFRDTESLKHIAAKLSTALLRHSDIIPADKAFFEAGVDARATGRDSEAFVFLNHYLDLCEAIEESNLDLLDHSDFALTDFPNEIPLPVSTNIPQSLHEEVKEWVLAVSMDQKVDQVLPVDERGLYPSALCSNDSAGPMALPCVVSGYPVLAQKGRTPIEFKRPGRAANREDWNKLLMAAKMNPESHVTDIIGFIGEWCGGTPSFSFQ
ncbi:intraflagellar transport protein 172 homolog [Schistocerca americana]|uniref:intraflagellar transport protein 172 homolog n=1 Tax=Schistocerca americana TaxID=7009 RepID=UPI001F503A6F|nr:intraflagellar transport protein 172 homolog [Schistocerca americana]